MKNFKQGDVVYLKSGSPAMTISNERKNDSRDERLIFFDGSQLKNAEIPNELLTDENPNFKTLETFAEPLKKLDIEDEVGKQLFKILTSCINDSKIESKLTLKNIFDRIELLNIKIKNHGGCSNDGILLEIDRKIIDEHRFIIDYIESRGICHLFEYSTKQNGSKIITIL